jgi:Polyketide cyclase / dehydrase and lipid transport
MLKTILIVLAVAIVALVAYAAMQPDSFRVERKITIKAAPEKIFAHLNDFKLWGAWSPWEKLDPNMARTFSTTTAGQGANYAWASDKVGAGRMEILESAALSKVRIKLDFTKPFEAHNLVDFTITPHGDGNEVTWAMHGPANFVSKLMGVLMSMDKMVGKDFEAGLRDLKAVSEK